MNGPILGILVFVVKEMSMKELVDPTVSLKTLIQGNHCKPDR